MKKRFVASSLSVLVLEYLDTGDIKSLQSMLDLIYGALEEEVNQVRHRFILEPGRSVEIVLPSEPHVVDIKRIIDWLSNLPVKKADLSGYMSGLSDSVYRPPQPISPVSESKLEEPKSETPIPSVKSKAEPEKLSVSKQKTDLFLSLAAPRDKDGIKRRICQDCREPFRLETSTDFASLKCRPCKKKMAEKTVSSGESNIKLAHRIRRICSRCKSFYTGDKHTGAPFECPDCKGKDIIQITGGNLPEDTVL